MTTAMNPDRHRKLSALAGLLTVSTGITAAQARARKEHPTEAPPAA